MRVGCADVLLWNDFSADALTPRVGTTDPSWHTSAGEKIAHRCIYSGAAFSGSLWATSGEVCALPVGNITEHREHRAPALAVLSWAHFHASLAVNLLSLPFQRTSQLLKCLKLNMFTFLYLMDALKYCLYRFNLLSPWLRSSCVMFSFHFRDVFLLFSIIALVSFSSETVCCSFIASLPSLWLSSQPFLAFLF